MKIIRFGVVLVFATILISGIVLLIKFKNHIKISKENVWTIGIYSGRDPLDLCADPKVINPVITASMVNDVSAAFVADPFLWKNDSIWYLFFEVLNKKDMKGDIGYAWSNDCKTWKYGKIIIDCPYHISYPYTFSWNDTLYMIPESAEAGYLLLYYAKQFPEKWEIADTLLHGTYGDHAIIRYNGMWWLFVNAAPVKNNLLKLYYAEYLYGEWVEHPQSPVIRNDDRNARPGGRMYLRGEKVLRLAQNCHKTYGIEVNAFEIEKLDKYHYEEIKMQSNPVISRGEHFWALHGMHNIDAFQIDDSTYVAAVDGYNKKVVVSIEF